MPELSPAARRDVEHARDVLDDALDGLRTDLLALSGDVSVSAKADGTPVTQADLDVEARLAERLLTAFADHGLISEETNTIAPDTDWTWIVDPIDGTSNFTNRVPYWCVSVALALEGRPVLGVIDAPVLGRRYRAVDGAGARVESRTTSLDGRRQQPRDRALRVREPVDWRDGRNRHIPVMLTSGTARRTREAGLRLNPRVMGSAALDLALVAEGVAAGSVAVIPRVWDVAAGTLLVREAGGVAVTLRGEPLLPVRAGVEQRERTAVTATGPDDDYVRGLVGPLLPPE